MPTSAVREAGMSFNYANVFRADEALKECARLNIDASRWRGLCNSYRNPRGSGYGEAWLLMARRDVMPMAKSTTNKPLTMTTGTDNNAGTSIAYLYFDYAFAAIPTMEDDDDSLYVVHAVDRRYLCNRYILRPRRYNVRTFENSGEFFHWSRNKTTDGGTTDAPVDWTWQTMFNDLFLTMQKGSRQGDRGPSDPPATNPNPKHLKEQTFPGFPNTWEQPATPPENYASEDGYFLDVLQAFLESVQLSLTYDSKQDKLTVCDTGAPDTDLTNLIDKYKGDIVYRDFGIENPYMLVPGMTRLIMPARHLAADGGELLYRRPTDFQDKELTDLFSDPADDVGMSSSQADPNAALLIRDELQAVQEPDKTDFSKWWTNGDARSDNDFFHDARIDTRAQDRGRSEVLSMTYHGIYPTFKRIVFSGCKPDIMPGNKVFSVRWGNTGGGPFTEVICGKSIPKPPVVISPPVFDGWYWGITKNTANVPGPVDGWKSPTMVDVELYEKIQPTADPLKPGRLAPMQQSITVKVAFRWAGVSIQPLTRCQVEWKHGEWTFRAIDCNPTTEGTRT